jgi:hypothetical protein
MLPEPEDPVGGAHPIESFVSDRATGSIARDAGVLCLMAVLTNLAAIAPGRVA